MKRLKLLVTRELQSEPEEIPQKHPIDVPPAGRAECRFHYYFGTRDHW